MENGPLELPVTVIMPVRNEERFIACSLGAVLAQDYPAALLQVIVADGMSEDGTREIIRELPGAERVIILDNQRRIKSPGVNLALQQAWGQVIVCVDGHSVIAPDYVRQCVATIQQTGAVGVGGPMVPVGTTPMGRAIAAATMTRFAVPSAFHFSTSGQFTDTVFMGAWTKEALKRVGGFDERLVVNQDYDVNYRIRRAGGRLYLSPAIRSQYFGRQTLGGLARQYLRYGRAKALVLRKEPASMRPRHLVAPLFVAALLAGAIAAYFSTMVLAAWTAIVALYLLIDLAYSASLARRAATDVLRTAVVYPTIHLSWGSGFWIGLIGGGGPQGL